MPSIKKCQAEKPADANQVGGDFRPHPATFGNPVTMAEVSLVGMYPFERKSLQIQSWHILRLSLLIFPKYN